MSMIVWRTSLWCQPPAERRQLQHSSKHLREFWNAGFLPVTLVVISKLRTRIRTRILSVPLYHEDSWCRLVPACFRRVPQNGGARAEGRRRHSLALNDVTCDVTWWSLGALAGRLARRTGSRKAGGGGHGGQRVVENGLAHAARRNTCYFDAAGAACQRRQHTLTNARGARPLTPPLRPCPLAMLPQYGA